MEAQYYWDLIQRTDEWYEARLGLLTASTMKLIITPPSDKAGCGLKVANNKETRSHMYELIAQRTMGVVEDTYQSYDMERGSIEEVHAKELYSEHRAQIRDCGFVTNEINGFTIGFSPDGMVGDDGFVECKSRKQKIQVKTILENEVPREDLIQIHTGLKVTGRKWCDYISYSNGMPMFIKRVYPDDVIIPAIEAAVCDFEVKAAKQLKEYNELTSEMIKAPRRDVFFGDEIKPSE